MDRHASRFVWFTYFSTILNLKINTQIQFSDIKKILNNKYSYLCCSCLLFLCCICVMKLIYRHILYLASIHLYKDVLLFVQFSFFLLSSRYLFPVLHSDTPMYGLKRLKYICSLNNNNLLINIIFFFSPTEQAILLHICPINK